MDLDQHQLWQRIIFIVIQLRPIQVRYLFLKTLFLKMTFFVETRPLRSSVDEPLLGAVPDTTTRSGK
jgi:hypothetical protein